MGTLRVLDFNNAADNTPATTTSTGAADIQTGSNGATITHETDGGLHGTPGLRVFYGTATGLPSMARFGFEVASRQVSTSVFVKCPATNPSVTHTVMGLRSGSSWVGYYFRGSTGNWAFQPLVGTAIPLLQGATQGALRDLRVTSITDINDTVATDGSATIKFYNALTEDLLGTYTVTPGTSRSLGTAPASTWQLGTPTSEGNSIAYVFDDLQLEDNTLTEIGPYVPSIPLDTPNPAVEEVHNVTTVSGSDGSAKISWPAVANANHYEVWIANGHDATSGYTLLANNVTDLFYWVVSLPASLKSIRVFAVPA